MRDTTSQEFFDEKYRQNRDPWHFASSEYERARYDAIFRATNTQRYVKAFEPGCSIGVLTARLAGICEHVLATDISPAAVREARQRCIALKNVEIACGALPNVVPLEPQDLIVLSEIGYYFTREQWKSVVETLSDLLVKHGALVAAHWLGSSEDHLLKGDEVHEVLEGIATLKLVCAEKHAGFRIDRWERP
jgi:cyclopropane fatty-acyl-phospholipid synthase-like methyltransferase